MSGINKAIIVGNLGDAPEVRFMNSGDAVANLSIATSESWKDKQTGEKKEKTEWHRVVIFGKLAEIAGEYLKKGSKVYVEGKLQTKKWTDNNGQDRYTTEIVLDGFNSKIEMLDGRNQSDGQSAGGHQQGGFQQQQAAQQSHQQQGGFAQQAPQQQKLQQAPQQQGGFAQQAPQHQGGFAQQAPQQNDFAQQATNANPQAPSNDFDDDIPF